MYKNKCTAFLLNTVYFKQNELNVIMQSTHTDSWPAGFDECFLDLECRLICVQVELALWDTSGHEDYDLNPISYPDTDVILMLSLIHI